MPAMAMEIAIIRVEAMRAYIGTRFDRGRKGKEEVFDILRNSVLHFQYPLINGFGSEKLLQIKLTASLIVRIQHHERNIRKLKSATAHHMILECGIQQVYRFYLRRALYFKGFPTVAVLNQDVNKAM